MSTEVTYFVGCTANYSEPEIGKAVVEVLGALGIHVVLPEQRCCSIAHLASGRAKAFRKNAGFNMNSLGTSGGDIVTACSTCAAALKHDYPRLLRTPEAEAVSRRTYDIMEYLVRHQERYGLLPLRSVKLSLVYHAPCHLVAVGGDLIEKRLDLLRSIPDLEVTHLDRGCCGMGGTFGMKQRNYEISMEIGESLFTAIKELHPDMVISECPGCRAQIAHGTGLPVAHPVVIIRHALSTVSTESKSRQNQEEKGS